MHWKWIPAPVPAVFLTALLIGCGACSDRPGGENPAVVPAANPPTSAARDEGAVDSPEDLLLNRHTLLPARSSVPEEDVAASGEIDESNRFSSAVVVIRRAFATEGDSPRSCSGVLLSPRLVLTAANCMCIPQNNPAAGDGMKSLADGIVCATTAAVQSFITIPGPSAGVSGVWAQKIAGTVQVHPAFKLLLDAQGNVVSSEADLATISLESPIGNTSPHIETPEADLDIGELLVMVDYGYGDAPGILGDTRRFREARVTKVPPTGGWAGFEQAGPHTYRGGRGGPCLRESGNGAVVVGILNGTFARQPSFTSTYPHRLWLREEIRRAAEEGTDPEDAHRKGGRAQ